MLSFLLKSYTHIITNLHVFCGCLLGTDAQRSEADLMQDWFNVVHEKNVLVRYESELMVQ